MKIATNYASLKYGDEFDCYALFRPNQSKFTTPKRVRVAEISALDRGQVQLKLESVYDRGARIVSLKFDEKAIVDRYDDRTPKKLTKGQECEGLLSEALGYKWSSPENVQKLIEDVHSKEFKLSTIRNALNLLDQRSQLVRCKHPDLGVSCYRKPLSSKYGFYLDRESLVGLPVVERIGGNFKAGYIHEFKVLVNSLERMTVPVCQWVNGGKTIANDKNLTILSTERKLSYFLEEVENFRDGKQSPPQKISQWTLNELRANPFDRQLLLDVGKEAGLIPEDRSIFRGNERNQVIDYLDKYYFGWNTPTFNYDNPKNDAQVEEDFER